MMGKIPPPDGEFLGEATKQFGLSLGKMRGRRALYLDADEGCVRPIELRR